METKRKFYIFCFTLLGAGLGLFISEIVQLGYLQLLLSDFRTFSFGMSWNELGQYYYFFSILLVVFCGLWGFSAGRFWWKQIYVLRNFDKRWKKFIK